MPPTELDVAYLDRQTPSLLQIRSSFFGASILERIAGLILLYLTPSRWRVIWEPSLPSPIVHLSRAKHGRDVIRFRHATLPNALRELFWTRHQKTDCL